MRPSESSRPHVRDAADSPPQGVATDPLRRIATVGVASGLAFTAVTAWVMHEARVIAASPRALAVAWLVVAALSVLLLRTRHRAAALALAWGACGLAWVAWPMVSTVLAH
jgi:hypothetical protein